MFTWLPVESIINDRQQEYYDAINSSNIEGESTKFITFMLSAIKSSIMEALNMSDEMIDEPMDENLIQKEKRWEYIRSYLQKNGSVRNAEICQVLGLSSSTANRLLRTWVYEKKLERYRDGRTWAYRLK